MTRAADKERLGSSVSLIWLRSVVVVLVAGSAGVQEQVEEAAHQDDGRDGEDDVRRRLPPRLTTHGHHLQQDV